MTRRRIHAGIVASIIPITLFAGIQTIDDAAGMERAVTQPNIVLITVDDMRYDDQPVLRSVRNLIGAADGNGGSYRNLVGATPLCSPTRATWLTGQYAHNHGVWGNTSGDDQGWLAFRPSQPNTLPVWLQDAGYWTGFIGKYMNGYNDPAAKPPGWNHWAAWVGKRTYNYTDFDVAVNGELQEVRGAYNTLNMGSRAVSVIEDKVGAPDPFYLQVNFVAPHSKATPSDKYRGTSDAGRPESEAFNEADVSDKPSWIRAKDPMPPAMVQSRIESRRLRLETLMSVDDQVERIVEAVRANRELANTLLIFTSDNGLMLGEHRIRGGKDVPYTESTHLPLFIRGPGFATGQIDTPVSTVDIAPTIARAAGATPRGGFAMDGMALQDDIPMDRPLLIENRGFNEMPAYRAVWRNGDLFVDYANGEQELYAAGDEWQQRNQADNPDFESVRTALSAELAGMRHCAGEGCRP